MDIFFNREPGKIFDIFSSLWIMNNYDYSMDIRRKYGVESITSYDELLSSLISNNIVQSQYLNKYFPKEIETQSLFRISSIWKHPNIKNFLSYLLKIDESKIREVLISSLNSSQKLDLVKEEITKIAESTPSLLKYLTTLDISNSLKWEIFCLLNSFNEFMKEFISFINNYLNIYCDLDKERNSILDEYNSYIEENISKGGIEFIKEKIANRYDLGSCEKIYVTTSVNISLYINIDSSEKACYIILGHFNDEVIKQMHLEDKLKNSLVILKNIVEDTRFDIIKLLSDKDYCNQELSDILKLSKATVSHHMSYLMSLNIVKLKKIGQRSYYCLNKDLLKGSLDMIIEELKLSSWNPSNNS